jgi:hypothetical protein
MQRFARLKNVQLRAVSSELSLTTLTDPFRFQLILATCIEYCLDHTAEGGMVTICCRRTGSNTTIRIRGNPDSSTAEKDRNLAKTAEDLRELLEELNVRLCPINRSGHNGLELILA